MAGSPSDSWIERANERSPQQVIWLIALLVCGLILLLLAVAIFSGVQSDEEEWNRAQRAARSIHDQDRDDQGDGFAA